METIQCLLACCDEVIVNVGFSDPDCKKDDGTFQAIQRAFNSNARVKIVTSYWDPGMTRNGEILAQQTDIALSHCQGEYCQYLQADEHIHEADFALIRGILPTLTEQGLDGAIYRYLHFYGNVDVLKYTRKLYRAEVRLIKNGLGIKSYRDAQGFRLADMHKLNCLMTPIRIFHYGWARKEMVMRKKVDSFGKIYHGNDHVDDQFQYQRIWGLRKFEGSHPAMMNDWIEHHRNDINILKLPLSLHPSDFRSILSDYFEAATGLRLGEYRNYRIGGTWDKGVGL